MGLKLGYIKQKAEIYQFAGGYEKLRKMKLYDT
jgi:hypothetical protein